MARMTPLPRRMELELINRVELIAMPQVEQVTSYSNTGARSGRWEQGRALGSRGELAEVLGRAGRWPLPAGSSRAGPSWEAAQAELAKAARLHFGPSQSWLAGGDRLGP
ncbi:hypothetical protein BRADI_3g15802v3 [Brachypodium distachyon]|nr:hypothetical protein BRADI_3g15802v3 [Brachypodium distachyon]